MPKKLYVGNLNYSTTEDQLRELFSEHGTILNVNIVTDRYTDMSKGFAFVEMEDETAAEAAKSALNNTELDGRKLRVDEARDRAPRKRSFRY